MKKQITSKNYNQILESMISGLSKEELLTLLHNIGLGIFATIPDIVKSILRLIESHIAIFDGKESLFFKSTGKQIWEKFD